MRPLPTAFVAFAALAAAGCGNDDNSDLVQGKALFVQKCGSCHTLKRAGTKGVQGPNLDNAFAAARRDGMTNETIEGIVYGQIGNVRRNSIMPANLVKGARRRDVAAYVGRAAAEPGQDAGQLAQAGKPKSAGKTAKASGGKLTLDADPTGALAFSAGKATAPAGALQLIMKNPASIRHNIAVEGNGVDEKGPVVGKGGTSTVKANLKPGAYTFLCTVPGHAAGGMKGTLTVK
ncbi:MAG TPA: plastocyanin/azurin family copper-binding protein [Thermoleophilaceae bacterium]|nr:plastocyanin/azurin family copper-binding protein [Thermoleophilaceae bacterium]